jgi:hypothetical protein
VTTAPAAPPDYQPTTRAERKILARARADALREHARITAQAEASVEQAQAAGIELANLDAALEAEHREWLRQRERDEVEQAARSRVADAVDAVGSWTGISATDRGDRLWAWVLTVPLVTGSTAAMFGQVASLHPRLAVFVADLGIPGWKGTAVALAVALAVGITLETVGLFMARLAHKARKRSDSPAIYRGVMWAIVLYAAGVNYHEWSPAWDQPSVLGVLFASLSIISVVGWELREHRADRDRRHAQIAELGWAPTPIPPRPEFGLMRWLVATRHTWTAWTTAVKERIPDAGTALHRADEILTARRTEQTAQAASRRGPGWVRLLIAAASRRRPETSKPPAEWEVGIDRPAGATLGQALRLVAPETRPALPPVESRTSALPPTRQESSAPTVEREAHVVAIGAAISDDEVLAAIADYHLREKQLPTPNWLKRNLKRGDTGVGSGRAKKLLDRYQAGTASREATG